MSFAIPQPRFNPLPDPAAVVYAPPLTVGGAIVYPEGGPQARFTLLSERLVRMELCKIPGEACAVKSIAFEDRPSQVFWRRRQPVPQYSVRATSRQTEIETAAMILRYRHTRRGFTRSTLSVEVKATGAVWRYGDSPPQGGNLGGTARTLDERRGRMRLEPGLVSRAGWALVDDSHTLVFNASGWLEARQATGNLDLYLFAHGHDYPGCLQEFSRVAGETPLLPRWALGNWWSRYWEYSADDLLALMDDFKAHEAPLSVCIVDMDWHLTQTGNQSSGWTGYTWNRQLFPDPPGFLAELHRRGLKTALNLHPAEGIHSHEEQYPAFARLMGLDPETGAPVPFECADPSFMRAYFELLHHPLEEQGVDFWWVDWQQGKQSALPGLDPLWWLNHLHFYDLGRSRDIGAVSTGRPKEIPRSSALGEIGDRPEDASHQKRPFVFSRWGGLGNHRYPIGFSGDTIVAWEALDFQPYFTATAANVAYGWWSHDIGGHMQGREDDELYARWVQYGVFSPILRLHNTKKARHERRPWGRGPAAERVALAALRLRHRLIPYLYTLAWRDHTSATPLVTPIYYTHPEHEEAYQNPQEYWFGSELLAAPFTTPADLESGVSRQDVWLPPDERIPDQPWFNFFTGERLSSGGHTIYGGLADIPVFARAGAIIPLGPEVGWGGVQNPETLHIYIFPGASNHFELYEDDGETQAYESGHYMLTQLELEWSAGQMRFQIRPQKMAPAAAGTPAYIPARRTIQLHLRGLAQPEQVQVRLNGASHPFQIEYETLTLSLAPVTVATGERLEYTCLFTPW